MISVVDVVNRNENAFNVKPREVTPNRSEPYDTIRVRVGTYIDTRRNKSQSA